MASSTSTKAILYVGGVLFALLLLFAWWFAASANHQAVNEARIYSDDVRTKRIIANEEARIASLEASGESGVAGEPLGTLATRIVTPDVETVSETVTTQAATTQSAETETVTTTLQVTETETVTAGTVSSGKMSTGTVTTYNSNAATEEESTTLSKGTIATGAAAAVAGGAGIISSVTNAADSTAENLTGTVTETIDLAKAAPMNAPKIDTPKMEAPRVRTIEKTVEVAEIEPIEVVAVAGPGGDIEAGKKLFKNCKACHQIGEGAKNKVGPVLTGILNNPVASVEGFSKYSKALKEAGAAGDVWSAENLDGFLTKPKAHYPGTKMVFRGFKKEQDRKDMIAYLESYE